MELNQFSVEHQKMGKSAIRVFLFCASIVYAVGFATAFYSQSHFLLAQFAVEAILSAIIILAALKFFK